jgi:hypothetical protein
VAIGSLCGATGVGNGGNGLAERSSVSGTDVVAVRQLAKARIARTQIVEAILRKNHQLVTFFQVAAHT